MNTATTLLKEKIVSLSDIQRNPAKALSGNIVRITRNGKEFGIFMTREEFEDIMEEQLALKSSFGAELDSAITQSHTEKLSPLEL